MNIKKLDVKTDNLLDIIMDPMVYVIRKMTISDEYRMIPVHKTEVGDLLSNDTVIIKIIVE